MATSLPIRVSRGLHRFFERDPFSSLQKEMDDLLGRFSREWEAGAAYIPSLDLSETDGAVQVRMDLPGLQLKDVDIEIAGNTLRVTGERKEEQEEKGTTCYRVERRIGQFARVISLPCPVQEDKIEASYADGVLTVTLPKSKETKARKIKVKTNGK